MLYSKTISLYVNRKELTYSNCKYYYNVMILSPTSLFSTLKINYTNRVQVLIIVDCNNNLIDFYCHLKIIYF